MEPVARTLLSEGCRQFFVATLEEAVSLREIIPRHAASIALLGGLLPGIESEYLAHDIVPVLNTLEEIDRWQKTSSRQETPLPAIVHFDTGMNRLGLGEQDAKILAEDPERLAGLNIVCLMSHFASADEPDSPLTRIQFDTFMTRVSALPEAVQKGAAKSIANSAGLFASPEYALDMVRPGMALYGLNPIPGQPNPMQPVAFLNARILQIRDVPAGETVGYGASHRFSKETRLATVAIGYADGFLRSLSNKATLFIDGKPVPVVGRVSMDLVTIDISALTENPPKIGDTVEILGTHQSADALADAAGTIGYEILTSLGNRFHRQYT